MRKNNALMIVAIVAALVVGCDNKPDKQAIQEVNDENCKIEVIKQIEDKETREQFAGRCSRRPVGIAATKKPKNWLELTN
jgi:entry exclusion lipoprotein TrbK